MLDNKINHFYNVKGNQEVKMNDNKKILYIIQLQSVLKTNNSFKLNNMIDSYCYSFYKSKIDVKFFQKFIKKVLVKILHPKIKCIFKLDEIEEPYFKISKYCIGKIVADA